MTKPEIAGEIRFGPSDRDWPILIDNKEVASLFHDDGYQVRFWLHGNQTTSVSMEVLSAISQKRKTLIRDGRTTPSFWLDFRDTMGPHALDITRLGERFGSLQWHDQFLVVFNRSKDNSDVICSVDDIDQLLRKRDTIIEVRKRT